MKYRIVNKSQRYRQNAAKVEQMLRRVLPMFATMLKLPNEEILIELGEYEQRFQASYSNSIKRIRLNCKYAAPGLLKSIAHELVHVEQYHTGKLAVAEGGRTWNGHLYRVAEHDPTAAINMPWEKEAYMRAPMLAQSIIDRLDLDFS